MDILQFVLCNFFGCVSDMMCKGNEILLSPDLIYLGWLYILLAYFLRGMSLCTRDREVQPCETCWLGSFLVTILPARACDAK